VADGERVDTPDRRGQRPEENTGQYAAGVSLPGFLRADVRRQLAPPPLAPDKIGAAVRDDHAAVEQRREDRPVVQHPHGDQRAAQPADVYPAEGGQRQVVDRLCFAVLHAPDRREHAGDQQRHQARLAPVRMLEPHRAPRQRDQRQHQPSRRAMIALAQQPHVFITCQQQRRQHEQREPPASEHDQHDQDRQRDQRHQRARFQHCDIRRLSREGPINPPARRIAAWRGAHGWGTSPNRRSRRP